MSAKKEPLECVLRKIAFIKACSSSFHDNKDEDIKVIDVSPIKYLFCNMNLDNDGTGDESTLARRRPDISEGENLVEKIDKSGFEEVKTIVMCPLFWITKTLIMIVALWLIVFLCCNP